MLISETVAFFRSALMTVQDILRMCKAVRICSSVWELFEPVLNFKSFARGVLCTKICSAFVKTQCGNVSHNEGQLFHTRKELAVFHTLLCLSNTFIKFFSLL